MASASPSEREAERNGMAGRLEGRQGEKTEIDPKREEILTGPTSSFYRGGSSLQGASELVYTRAQGQRPAVHFDPQAGPLWGATHCPWHGS